jgi:hypothetical protein
MYSQFRTDDNGKVWDDNAIAVIDRSVVILPKKLSPNQMYMNVYEPCIQAHDWCQHMNETCNSVPQWVKW